MVLARRRIPDVLDFAVGGDQEGAADNTGEYSPHELLGTPRAISFDHFVARIAEQRKIEFLLGFEFRLGGLRIRAGTQDHHIQLVEFFLCVTKLGRFGRSTRRVCLGIEKEDDSLAAEISQREIGSGVGL